MEENPEESLNFEVDETIGGHAVGISPTKGRKRINNVEAGTKAMLEWIRLPENEELYNNLLAFRTVNLHEFMGIIERSTHCVQKITKKILPDVLDKLYIGFYVPDKKWKRRAGYKSG
uniref:Transposase n=1 Tax=Panagrolaimus sp. ES5 TaxID=591445 RepID=A0AC34GE27_9BILA